MADGYSRGPHAVVWFMAQFNHARPRLAWTARHGDVKVDGELRLKWRRMEEAQHVEAIDIVRNLPKKKFGLLEEFVQKVQRPT